MAEEIDLQMHNCMTVIWAAYRTGNVEKFNKTFADLVIQFPILHPIWYPRNAATI